MTADSPAASPVRPQIRVLLTVVFLVYLGQMTLNPIIAPLAREVGLAEWQIGATISTAAIMVVVSSQFWGRRSQSWGRKRVLVIALTLATVSTALFALASFAGLYGIIVGGGLFALFVLLRGVGFGTAIAAVPPTAQAYIADITTDEDARVKGMAGVGAVQGIAIIGGAVLGGLLADFGLLTPLVAVPCLLAFGLGLVVLVLRREPRHELIADPARIRISDPRAWPFLVAGFGLLTSLGFIQIIAGFIVQDRLGLGPEATGTVTGGVLMAAGIGMVLAQAFIVPRSGWSTPTLLRVGAVTALVGFLVLIPEAGLWPLVVGILLIGLGLGIALPGYTAGPTLLMRRDEQGGLAGLIGATNGLTFVVAPTASTALYGLWPQLPVTVGALVIGTVAIFVVLHPRFRELRGQQPGEPAGQESGNPGSGAAASGAAASGAPGSGAPRSGTPAPDAPRSGARGENSDPRAEATEQQP